MNETIKKYNHELVQKLVDKASFENEYMEEVKEFDLFKYLYEEAK